MVKLDNEYEVAINELPSKNNPSHYDETRKKLCTIRTTEELSYFLRHLKSFEDTPQYNLNVFKGGITASWEDPANIAGCSWIVQFKAEVSNILFERLCMYFCLVGFKKFDCNGINANVRKGQVKFTIWSANVPRVIDGAAAIDEMQQAFGLDYEIEFTYKNHKQLLEKLGHFIPNSSTTV